MDDTNKILQQQSTTSSDQPVPNAPQAPIAEPQPDVSLMHKEQEPLPSNPFIKATEVEPVVNGEIKEFGVDVIGKQNPQISQEAHFAGVRLAGEALPIPSQPSSSAQILTREEAVAGRKSGVGNSLSWLSALILKIMNPGKKSEAPISQ